MSSPSARPARSPDTARVPSPVTGSDETEWVESIEVAWIRRCYADMGVDIERFVEGLETVEVHRCVRTGYEFYWPPRLAGDERFYRELSVAPWYYDEARWEHAWMAERLGRAHSLLDVGCGSGAFLARVAGRWPGVELHGLELNRDAVAAARAAGLRVEERTVEAHASDHEGAYDVVGAFQVLEHLTHPRSFLEGMVTSARPGGLVVIGVPNNDGYVGQIRTLLSYGLNLPPHHMGLWRPSSLAAVADLLGLEVVELAREPLDPASRERLAFGRISARLPRRLAGLAWRLGAHRLYSRAEARSLGRVDGHTILAVLRRPGPDPVPLEATA